MSLVATRAPRLGNLVKYEEAAQHGFTREAVTVNTAAAQDLKIGSVLGKITANGKYTISDPAAIDGSEVAAAVVLENISTAIATDITVTVMVRGSAILGRDALVFDVAHSAGEIATVEAELAALNILVRTQV